MSAQHPTEWTLRRLRAGELAGAERHEAQAHVTGCTRCSDTLQTLSDEQASFESRLPFERFEAGVERASQGAQRTGPRVNGLLVAVAATVLLAIAVRPLMTPEGGHNRLKGTGASAELRIGNAGPQRAVMPGDSERLLPEERVRLGYTAGPYTYVLAVSVDDRGDFTPLYTDLERSLAVEPGTERHWLPESLRFTGSGPERVLVLLSHEPLRVEEVREAVLREWRRAGSKVEAMQPLGLEGEEVDWVLRKP
jgi:hypothetical protein